MELNDSIYIAIFDKFRSELTSIADDETLRKWGNSEERINEIKLKDGKDLIRRHESGVNIHKLIFGKTLGQDIFKHLCILENYLRGEHNHETDEIQQKEDYDLYLETIRLKELLMKNFDLS